MVTAYVMVKALTGDADELKAAIGAVEGVTDVHIVAGDVDLIAKVDVDATADVKEVVAARVHALDGVDTTQTYIAMD